MFAAPLDRQPSVSARDNLDYLGPLLTNELGRLIQELSAASGSHSPLFFPHFVREQQDLRRQDRLKQGPIRLFHDPLLIGCVADLAERYLERHVAVRCKPKTQRTTRCVVSRHIVPALGRLPIAAVERRHVMALHESLCETPAMANMVVATLSHMYVLAGDWEMMPEDCANPCQAIPANPERKRERFLTDAEPTRLGQVLDEVSATAAGYPPAR